MKAEKDRKEAEEADREANIPTTMATETLSRHQRKLREKVEQNLYERQQRLVDKREELRVQGQTRTPVHLTAKKPPRRSLGYTVTKSLDLTTMRRETTSLKTVDDVVGALARERKEMAAAKQKIKPTAAQAADSEPAALDIHTRQVVWRKEKSARDEHNRRQQDETMEAERRKLWNKVRRSTDRVLGASKDPVLVSAVSSASLPRRSRSPAASGRSTANSTALSNTRASTRADTCPREAFPLGEGPGGAALQAGTPHEDGAGMRSASSLPPPPTPTTDPARLSEQQVRERALRRMRTIEERWEALEVKKIEKQLVACEFDKESVSSTVQRMWAKQLLAFERSKSKVTRKQRQHALDKVAGLAFENLHRAKVHDEHKAANPFQYKKKTKPIETEVKPSEGEGEGAGTGGATAELGKTTKFQARMAESKSVSRRQRALDERKQQAEQAKQQQAKHKAKMDKRRQALAANHKRVTGEARNPFVLRDLIKGVGSGAGGFEELDELDGDEPTDAEGRVGRVWDKLARHLKRTHTTTARLFEELDRDRSGTVSTIEFVKKIGELIRVDLQEDPEALALLMAEIDADGDHELNYTEFARRLKLSMPKPPAPPPTEGEDEGTGGAEGGDGGAADGAQASGEAEPDGEDASTAGGDASSENATA